MDNTKSYEPKTSAIKDPAFIAIIIFITLIGLAIRLAPTLQTQFPLNDGGLFYAMIVDLQEAHYALPLFAAYNHAQIPFAYPPLAFYITGLLADLLHIAPIELVRILPALISTLTIPAFYLLARELTDSPLQIVFGTFAFALLPRTFAWSIMGGGITRSFGMLFAMLTMVYAYRFYKAHQTRHLLSSILLGALTVFTHPEASVHTAITALVFYLWKDRSRKGFLLSLGIAAGILALTAPWWGLVISRHGAGPFIAAMTASGQDSFNPLVGLFIFFRFLFTDEAFLPLLSMLGLIGLFASLARKQTLLPGWLIILHLIEPRGGTLYMMLPLSLLIGYALDMVVLPALQPNDKGTISPINVQQALENTLLGKTSRYFLLFLFAYSLMSAYTTGQKIKNDFSLQPVDMEAFAWVKENTPQDSEFLLVTGQLPLRDAWSEWFPVLTDRHSQGTIFGYEWVNDGQFGSRVESYENLQACSRESATCLDNWNSFADNPFSYVYLWNRNNPEAMALYAYLEHNSAFELVYQNERNAIFRQQPLK
ncbi:MAG: glycosyltransferase family 39 protein [Anaerolineales bacterium]